MRKVAGRSRTPVSSELQRLKEQLKTQRRRSRQLTQAMRSTQDWLRFALDAARLVAWQWDLRGAKVERYGDTAAVWGIPADYLDAHPDAFFRCVHREDRDRVRRSMREAPDAGTEIEFRLISPIDRSERWISDRHRVMPASPGKRRCVCGISTDITLRKQWQQQLTELNQVLEEHAAESAALADERREQLRQLALELSEAEDRERRRVAQVLHDHLQQLMVAVKMRVESLARSLPGDKLPAISQITDLIRHSMECARTLAVELNPPVLAQSGLAAALRWLGDWMREQHQLNVEVDADPAANPDSPAVGSFLFQSSRELLFNVIKHAQTDKATLTMHTAPGNNVEIIVMDGGKGFDAEAATRDAERNQSFGLFSIRERLDRLGGEFHITSNKKAGTQIRLVVPRRRVEPPPEITKAAAVALTRPGRRKPRGATGPAPGRGNRGKLRILLVDDHAMVRDGLAEIIRRERDMHLLASAADGQAAVELTKKLRPDIVIMDVNMPVMNGLEATRHIVHDAPGLPVIGLSLHDDPEIAQRMRDAGAVAYISKSADPAMLLQALRDVRSRRAPAAGKSRRKH